MLNKLLLLLGAAALVAAGVFIGSRDASQIGALFIAASVDDESLPLGAPAPDFSLPGVDGAQYALEDFRDAELLAVIFTCNHCPTAQAYEQRIMQLANAYDERQLAVVAISPNDEKAIRLDELGYTDLNDSLAEMKIRAQHRGFNFPYLYDGEQQAVSRAYGPLATPHVFLFDRERKLRYKGRFDDNENPAKTSRHDVLLAVNALLRGTGVEVATTRVFGCSIKWSEKIAGVERQRSERGTDSVSLEAIVDPGFFASLRTRGEWQLVNIWATWCAPCKKEFPSLVDSHAMYRGRGLEFVTISLDDQQAQQQALAFLQERGADMQNYRFAGSDRDALGDSLGLGWQGAVPFTALIAPSGQVVYREHGPFDELALRRAIADNLGRTYF